MITTPLAASPIKCFLEFAKASPQTLANILGEPAGDPDPNQRRMYWVARANRFVAAMPGTAKEKADFYQSLMGVVTEQVDAWREANPVELSWYEFKAVRFDLPSGTTVFVGNSGHSMYIDKTGKMFSAAVGHIPFMMENIGSWMPPDLLEPGVVKVVPIDPGFRGDTLNIEPIEQRGLEWPFLKSGISTPKK